MRTLIGLGLLTVCWLASGCACVGPCYDPLGSDSGACCDGYQGCERRIPCTPLQGLRAASRSLVCGAGCGDVYYGEWLSTPPHCCDPCDPCDACGGCGVETCLPFVRLRYLLSGLVGRRLRCDHTPGLLDGICGVCGCCEDECTCDDCGETEYLAEGEFIEGESIWDDTSVAPGVEPTPETLPPPSNVEPQSQPPVNEAPAPQIESGRRLLKTRPTAGGLRPTPTYR